MEKIQMNGCSVPTVVDEDSSAHSYHLVLFSDSSEMLNMWLPKEPEGFFQFSDRPEHRFLSVYAQSSQWIAACNKPAFFSDVPLDESFEKPLKDAEILSVNYHETKYKVLVEKVSRQRSVFYNYPIRSEKRVVVGSHPDSDIYYQGPFVAEKHAEFMRHNGRWSVQSRDDIFEIYVNGERCHQRQLRIGDVVYIMGLKIIVGHKSLAINNGLGVVTVSPRALEETTVTPGAYSHYYEQEQYETEEQFFNRAPRKRREQETKIITLEAPPPSMDQKKMPLFLRMGSSMVMGGAAALSGNFTSLLTSVLFPLLSNRYTDSERQEYEELRTSKYTEYLNKKRQEIADTISAERILLNEKYPVISDLVDDQMLMKRLWERRPCDSDFLEIRLGTGKRPMSAKIDYPVKRFELEQDALEEKMYEMAEDTYYVDRAPIVLSLKETFVCGIQGSAERRINFAMQLALQTALFHSYDEVKMVFLVDKKDLNRMDAVRYLPHVWDDQRSMRFIATNEAEAYAVGEYIKNRLPEGVDEKKEIRQIVKERPYFIIFALDKKLAEGHELFKNVMQAEENQGISVITAHTSLPKESQKIISLETRNHNICTTMGVDGGDDEVFALDALSDEQTLQMMHTLANISIRQESDNLSLPKTVTFMEMFKTGRIEQLNPLKRWHDNNPTKSLAAPVGVCEDGSLFILDLHEKRQGPHGLVAGMTGSGKSEFLITYILSMAVNYHPDEVAFVLIDYKGGGLADAFENPRTGVRLPHLAGTITNLDGGSIQRSLMSIESELVRRQKVFSEVSKRFDEGSMNIYTYQKLYRAGKVSKPMPHLFIVSDEFAELKQQQPEFMDKLISAARIGRSLGIHLILATQKPSGVVNDQIRSNTKFRVCLRVQDRSDSMDMLKRPEAAELTDTGRFYLQVGYNEYFALGQSAWCGADYEPQDVAQVRRDDAIEFLDITGQEIAKANPKVKKTKTGKKQIVAVVEYLSDLANNQGIQPKQLWEPELPRLLSVEELETKYGKPKNKTSIHLGLLDNPKDMEQFPLTLDFATCGNLLISGDSGSGKTTLVQSILCGLAQVLTPEEFNFYALDYSSRMLKQFKPLPHCGAILQEEDVGLLDEFFKLINGIVAKRKRIFSKLEVDSFQQARKIQKLPVVLVVIDNVAGLQASKVGENHIYRLQQYLKTGVSYGIKYILTCNHMNEVSSRIRQEIGERICFNLKDKYSYDEAIGCKTLYIPPAFPGRGLGKVEDCALEFQAAIIGDPASTESSMKQQVAKLRELYGVQAAAQRLGTADLEAEYEDFVLQFKKGRIPLGFSKSTNKPVALPLKQLSTMGIYIGNERGLLPITNNFIHAIQREQMEALVITRSSDSLFDSRNEKKANFEELSNAEYVSCSVENLRLLQRALIEAKKERVQVFRQYCQKNGIEIEADEKDEKMFSILQQETTPVVLVIESMADFCSCLNTVSTASYENLFKDLWKYNIFVLAFFEPGIPKEISDNGLFALFRNKDLLLFGGNFDKQEVYPMSDGMNAGSNIPFNSALMLYRKKMYAIVMPCGKTEEIPLDEDTLDIFN